LTVAQYISHFGTLIAIALTLSTLFIFTLSEQGTNYWMSLWVDQGKSIEGDNNMVFYLGIYMMISLFSTAMEGVVFLSFMRGSWVVAKTLHAKAVSAVMNAPLSWFGENPVGRIVNRLSGDMDSLDQSIAEPLTDFLDECVKVLLKMSSVVSVLPSFIIPATVLSALGALVGEIYSRAAVSTKRLVSSSQSPVLSHISSSLDGQVIIRAQGGMPVIFNEKLNKLLYDSARAMMAQRECDQWLKFRTNSIKALINVLAGILALSRQRNMSAGLVAFSLSQAAGMSASILRLVFGMNELNIELQAVRTPSPALNHSLRFPVNNHRTASSSIECRNIANSRLKNNNLSLQLSSETQNP
jgi:ABC-type multidrug transport system fused ATPase/permease subunit